MDPTVTVAAIAAAVAVLGPPITWVLARSQNAATVELTEAQAEQIRTSVYDRLLKQMDGEITRLQGRVTELEQRLAALDLALREKSAELVGVQADRDQLRIQLAAAHAELHARDREIGDLRNQVNTLNLQATLVQPPPAH